MCVCLGKINDIDKVTHRLLYSSNHVGIILSVQHQAIV